MVRKLLVENALEVRRAHSFGHMAVGGMAEKKFALGRYGDFDIFAPVDIFLTAVDHTDVAAAKRQQLVLQHLASISTFVHQVQFGDNTNGSQS